MSAQTAQEPSMEDILASIRKIISEDSNDDAAAIGAPTPIADTQKPVDGPEPGTNVSAPGSHQPQKQFETTKPTAALPPSLVERRETLDGDVIAKPPISRENDILRETEPPVDNKPADAPNSITSVPGFIERKPSPQPEQVQNESVKMEVPLHPAITNAKAFVSSNVISDDHSVNVNNAEAPVFENTNTIDARSSATPLVSPDTIERRDEEERRNHPLRRDADRGDAEFRNALMSPVADNAVASAFEQLKNSATDNLDGKVEALLRPMLREWLDNNLPSMVERLVRDEIERVSRGD